VLPVVGPNKGSYPTKGQAIGASPVGPNKEQSARSLVLPRSDPTKGQVIGAPRSNPTKGQVIGASPVEPDKGSGHWCFPSNGLTPPPFVSAAQTWPIGQRGRFVRPDAQFMGKIVGIDEAQAGRSQVRLGEGGFPGAIRTGDGDHDRT